MNWQNLKESDTFETIVIPGAAIMKENGEGHLVDDVAAIDWNDVVAYSHEFVELLNRTGVPLTAPEVMPLVRALVDREIECSTGGGNVGGHLHVLLADGAMEDIDASFCLGEAEKDHCEICTKLADWVVRMSRRQRKKLVGTLWNYWDGRSKQ